MAQSISQEAVVNTGLPGATAASRYAGATTSGAPTTGTFAVGDFIVDQSGSTWICTASSQTASATTASGNGNLITFTASNSFSPGQYVNVTGFSNTGYNVSNAVIGSASSTQFTVVSSATGTTTGTGTAVTTGTWQLSGVSVNENIAGKNFIINGGMDIWQRGTSFVNGGYPNYAADRWQMNTSYSNTTYSQVASGLTGFNYAIQVQRTSGSTQSGSAWLATSLETQNSLPMAGQTVTLSFWAKCGANYSATSNAFNVQLISGTGTDQNVLGGFTGASALVNTNATLTTSWQRFTYTVSVGSTATQLGIALREITTGTAGTNDWYQVTGVQLEISSTATAFSRAGGTIQGELAACQRYFWNQTSVGASTTYAPFGVGQCYSSTNAIVNINFPVAMRANPSITPSSPLSGMAMSTAVLGGATVTSISSNGTTSYIAQLAVGSGGGLSAGNATTLGSSASNTAYIQFSAEL